MIKRNEFLKGLVYAIVLVSFITVIKSWFTGSGCNPLPGFTGASIDPTGWWW